MWIPDFILKFFGHKVADKLDLQEDAKMDETKKWYQSKTIWAGIAAVLLSAYGTAAVKFGLPAVPEWVYTLLGAIGIYSRVTADAKIG
jgi:hypothetical protein